MWAYGRVHDRIKAKNLNRLFQAMTNEIKLRLNQKSLQISQPSPSLSEDTRVGEVEAETEEAEDELTCGFSPQELANIVWGYAKVGVKNKALLRQLSVAITEDMEHDTQSFTAQGVTNIAWAFATLKLV